MSDYARLREAVDIFSTGEAERAREMLKKLAEDDPDDEFAWLWYAYVLEDYHKKAAVLESFLTRHPESEEVRKRLTSYTRKLAEAARTPDEDVSRHEAQETDVAKTATSSSTLDAWQADKPISEKLYLARHELLDLSNRNPLVNYRLLKARGVEIDEPDAEHVFAILVENGKQNVSLLPIPEEEDKADQDMLDLDEDLPSLSPEPEDRTTTRSRRALQTTHTAKELDKRLLRTYYAARTYMEEQGINVLFLAFGMLHWYEAADSEVERLAPLVLVPVEITRTDVRSQFRIHYTEDDLGENLSLREKLRREFGIELPPMPEIDDFDLNAYLAQVAAAVRRYKTWRVDTSAIALGFFSFATFLMYNDLLEESWDGIQDITTHPLMKALLVDGFHESQSPVPEDAFIDDLVNPAEAPYVVDADSSQLAALLEVSRGRNMVIQGPPGTGKSQTITNIIAEAVAQGKRVLFVAEKMAALEVVKRRLDAVGLGAACLELHSQKSSKRAVLDELNRTLQLGQPQMPDSRTDLQLLVRHRDQLNAYSEAVNTPIGVSTTTPFQCYGYLLTLSKTFDGVQAPMFHFAPMTSWSSEDYHNHRRDVAELQTLIERIGVPADHLFWGADPPNVTPISRRTFLQVCRDGLIAIGELQAAADNLTTHLGVPAALDRAAAEPLCALASRVAEAPDLAGVNVEDGAWHKQAGDIKAAVASAQRLAEIYSRYDDLLIPEAWDHPMRTIKAIYEQYGDKWWRYLKTDFRNVKKELTSLFREKPPRSIYEQVAVIDAIEESQNLTRIVQPLKPLLGDLYGDVWRGPESEWPYLLAVAAWLQDLHRDIHEERVPSEILTYIATGPDAEALRRYAGPLQEALSDHTAKLAAALSEVNLDEAVRFGQPSTFAGLPFADQIAFLQAWIDGVDRLQEMVVYHHHANRLTAANLKELVEIASTWPGAGTLLVALYDRTWYEGLLTAAIDQRPALAMFDRETHMQTVEEFRQFDRLHFRYHQIRLAKLHWDGLPGGAANDGQMGILHREFAKKRRHYPIRKLMRSAGNAIQALKPVFMMSPLSIAMYLPPGSVDFDLVVFDEASQVRPADAIGAMLRGKQVVVTGDNKQLPPTNFFAHIAESDEEVENIAADVESVLGLLSAQGAPQKMLNWHYRSRHDSLIAVSNYEFYDNHLVVFPSPDNSGADTGLVFHHLPQAYYDRGKSRTNRQEALHIAQAVMDHARTRPERSLGVAAFSISQMNAIQNQVERLRRQDPSCEPFFNAHPYEPFFVKNLENVQGDERDVIFISVGYGRSADGRLTMSFGPLNREGGERRLNVLITRARYRCEVFSNLTADDIDLGRTQAKGVIALKRFLKYAASRDLDVPVVSGHGADSPFEEHVAAVLRDRGYIVEHQVGSAGFFIDLAVKDEAHPGRYLIGIECDGATYHSARSARDRDRLRQEVLEGLGWRIHRIWSTDWFYRREREIEKLLAAVEEARSFQVEEDALAGPSMPEPDDPPAPAVTEIPRAEVKAQDVTFQAEPYRIAKVRVRYDYPLHKAPPRTVATWVTKVVQVESPIHLDELTRRIVEASAASRTGRRIREAILNGVRHAERVGKVRRRDGFVWLAGMTDAPVRDRSNLPTKYRKYELVAPKEVTAAVLKVVDASMGIQPEDVPSAVCSMLGFGRTSADMDVSVRDVVQQAIDDGLLTTRGGYLICEER